MRNQLIILFIFIISSIFAQVRLQKPEMYIGITSGATGSMINFVPAVKQSYLLGYNAGLVFRYNAEKNVGMQAELNYSQRGWNESTGIYAKQLNYIELPFMTHIYMGKKNRFFINIGPKISYLLSEKVIVNNTTNSTEEQHITASQNPLDYGLCFGFGQLFAVKRNIVQIDVRAYSGLSDIYSNDKRDYFANSNNLNVSLNLAWLLQVK